MEYNKKIILEDGSEYYGRSFGADNERVCEIVFNTSMVGYQEIISDPSYTYQAVVMTYPLIGNYGINDDDFETSIPTIGGLIVREYNDFPSNFRSSSTLFKIMEKYHIPGIYGVDTRKITRSIRELGSRKVPFGREIYIDREDFMEEPPKKYFRMFPGNEVRLMNAYFVTCNSFVKDENGKVTEIHCTYDPASRGGNSPDGRKVKGTIQWVSAEKNVKAEIRLYENIVDEEKGVYNEDGSLNLNPNSLTVLKDCYAEENLADAKAYDSFQFVRQGFFCVDAKDSTPEHLVFNRIVSLKSSFKLPSNN